MPWALWSGVVIKWWTRPAATLMEAVAIKRPTISVSRKCKVQHFMRWNTWAEGQEPKWNKKNSQVEQCTTLLQPSLNRWCKKATRISAFMSFPSDSSSWFWPLTSDINKARLAREVPLTGYFLFTEPLLFKLWRGMTQSRQTSSSWNSHSVWRQERCHVQSHWIAQKKKPFLPNLDARIELQHVVPTISTRFTVLRWAAHHDLKLQGKKSNTKTGQFSKYIIFCWFLTRCHYTQPIF